MKVSKEFRVSELLMKGIKIISDGSITGTRVFSCDGEDLTVKLHICRIRWNHDAAGIPTAEIVCSLAAIDGTIPDAESVTIVTVSKTTRESFLKKFVEQLRRLLKTGTTVKPKADPEK